jgi:hypothetical protein
VRVEVAVLVDVGDGVCVGVIVLVGVGVKVCVGVQVLDGVGEFVAKGDTKGECVGGPVFMGWRVEALEGKTVELGCPGVF